MIRFFPDALSNTAVIPAIPPMRAKPQETAMGGPARTRPPISNLRRWRAPQPVWFRLKR